MKPESRTDAPPATEKWASFHLAGELFALRVEEVQEVLMQQPITPVPLAPDFIIGLVNLRGRISLAIDLRRRLQLPPRADGAPSVLLVLKHKEGLIGVVVDEMEDVLELPTSAWRTPPDTLAEEHRGFVAGVCPTAGRLVLGLRTDPLSGGEQSITARDAAPDSNAPPTGGGRVAE